MEETKSVSIGVPAIVNEFSPKEKWEKAWEQLHSHEPNNRQKRRRMEREWVKHTASQVRKGL